MMSKGGTSKPILVLVGICFVVSAMLAGVYMLTAPVIQARAAEAADKAKTMVLPEGDSFTPFEGTLVEGVSEAHLADNGAGMVCTVTTKGFGGGVEFVVGVNSNKEITGIQVMKHAETPGVGTNALTDEYLAKYNGQTSGDNVDAYSGATFTSKAVKAAVNAAILQLGVTQGEGYEAPVEMTEDDLIAKAAADLLGAYNEKTDVTPVENVLRIFESTEGKGYAMLVQGVGHYYNDLFRLVVGVGPDGAVTGITTIYQNETPGFGYEVLEEGEYYKQFIGATAITRKSNGDGTKIDTVSGATETSVGAFNCVKAALEQFAALQ